MHIFFGAQLFSDPPLLFFDPPHFFLTAPRSIFRIISTWSQQIVHQQYSDGDIGATSSSSWWVLEKGRGRYPNSKQKNKQCMMWKLVIEIEFRTH